MQAVSFWNMQVAVATAVSPAAWLAPSTSSCKVVEHAGSKYLYMHATQTCVVHMQAIIVHVKVAAAAAISAAAYLA
jgi:hypothetical protein